jgi:hypothetical protein
MKYQEVLRKVYAGDFSTVPERLLCLDPGETTGYALFEKGCLKAYGQIETVVLNGTKDAKQGEKVIDWYVLEELFCNYEPTYVVCENYRIYAHKLERHSFSQVETLRLIGGIDMLCHNGWIGRKICNKECEEVSYEFVKYYQPIPIAYQMAVQAKGFVTDERLKEWDFWKPGMRHSRDAIRHGLYFLIITNRPKGGY